MKKIIKTMFISIAILIAAMVVIVWAYMLQPKFGNVPAGARLERMQHSSRYKDGAFQNISFTPDLAEDATYFKVFRDFFFGKSKRSAPAMVLPSKKADLKHLDPNEDIIVWFGHSSYFMQVDGKRILVDPVLSGSASPVSFTTRSFKGADVYTVDDLPNIDYLFISHDHYDHLDYTTIVALKDKVKKVITGLGVGAHLEGWGYDTANIIERDWNEEIALGDGFVVHTTPARHFSGRKFKRNNTLWMSYVLYTPHKRIYIGGDSGYDTHFAEIGKQFGPFDLAILENGQYNHSWKYIHMMPEEVVQAAIDLNAKTLFPVHWSKFALGLHDWDEPILRVVKEAHKRNVPLMHPLIGEVTSLKDTITPGAFWWEGIK